jgi:hypothetical protein
MVGRATAPAGRGTEADGVGADGFTGGLSDAAAAGFATLPLTGVPAVPFAAAEAGLGATGETPAVSAAD